MSHVIDYSDHYSHSDPSIGPYNFLQFDDEQWMRFNPSIHFQNRLRHVDYRALFEELGLCVLQETWSGAEGAELISAVPLAERFKCRPLEELVPVVGHYVLKKAQPSAES